jgi:hypothetical protein
MVSFAKDASLHGLEKGGNGIAVPYWVLRTEGRFWDSEGGTFPNMNRTAEVEGDGKVMCI